MRVLAVALLLSCAVPASAGAAFEARPPLVVGADTRIASPAVDVADDGDVLAAVASPDGNVILRDRASAGAESTQVVQVDGAVFALRTALQADGGALAAFSTRTGTALVQRSPGEDFGPAIEVGGLGSRAQALGADAAGNAAVVTSEGYGSTARLQLRTRPAGGSFGAPMTLVAAEGDAALAFGADGALAVTWVERDANVRGVRVRARTGTVADLGPTRTVAGGRSAGDNISRPSVAMLAGGRAVVVVSTYRYDRRTSSQDVAVAEAPLRGDFTATRPLAQNATGGRVAASGPRAAFAWLSSSPRSGQAGVRVSLRRADGSFAPSQDVSPPERGQASTGRPGEPVAGTTKARSGEPELAISVRGDVAVSFARTGSFTPSTVLAAVRTRGAAAFDGPQPVSPLGASARPAVPAWTGDGGAVAPFVTERAPGARRSLTADDFMAEGLGLAVRAPGSALAAGSRDHAAARVRMSEPTLADLRAGVLASRVSCSEPCAFTARSQINVASDIAKPRGQRVFRLAAGETIRIAVPLQDSQRQRLMRGGARVRAVLSVGVVDRLGNAGTARARICLPRRSRC